MRGWTVTFLLLAAGCGGSTDYDDPVGANAGVNQVADDLLLDIDSRARAETLANGQVPASATASYSCTDGTRFEARFDNRAQTATLVFVDATRVELRQERAASGIWYRGDAVELRGKADEATLSREGRPDLSCTAG